MAILLALGSALVYGVADYCGGRSSRFHPAAVVTLIGQTVSLLIVGTLVLLGNTPMPDGATLAWSLGGGAAGAFALLALYHAFAHGAMTVVAPLSAVVGAAVPVIAGRIVGERPAAIAYVGIALALVAVALVSGVPCREARDVEVTRALRAIMGASAYRPFDEACSQPR